MSSNPFFQGGMFQLPIMMQHPQNVIAERHREEPPVRIRVILSFLNDLTSKTMPRVAVSEHQIHEIAGQPLTKGEINAQATACNVLNDYFLGNLEPCRFEKEKVGNKVLPCPICSQRETVRKDCNLCAGMGGISVTPVEWEEE